MPALLDKILIENEIQFHFQYRFVRTCCLPLTHPARLFALFCLLVLPALPALAQENYFVTYSHQMEEPGNLEIATRSVTASPKGGNAFVASALEFEYGVKAWWTSELYLS